MPRIMLTRAEVEHAKMLDFAAENRRRAARRVKAALSARECVWCAEPIEPWQTYPGCRECIEYKGYDLR